MIWHHKPVFGSPPPFPSQEKKKKERRIPFDKLKKRDDLQNTFFFRGYSEKGIQSLCSLPMYCKVPQIVPVRSRGFTNFARPKSTSFMCPKVINLNEIFLSWHSLDPRQRKLCSCKINLPFPHMSQLHCEQLTSMCYDLKDNLQSRKKSFRKGLIPIHEATRWAIRHGLRFETQRSDTPVKSFLLGWS